jgi:hypothetical protein
MIHTFDTTLDFGDLWDGPRKALVSYKRDGSMIMIENISLGDHDSQNYLEVVAPRVRERIKRQIEAFVFNLDTVSDAIFDWDDTHAS